MFNRIILVGRLTRDPELRYTANGVARTTFTLAVDRPYTTQNGERLADFFNVVTWNKVAENCAEHLKKGRLILVEGRLESRSFENNEGQRIRVVEVVAFNVRFLDSSSKSGSSNNPSSGTAATSFGAGANDSYYDDPFMDIGEPLDISEDDLPF